MSDPSADGFSDIAVGFFGARTVVETIDRVTSAAVKAVGAEAASVAFFHHGRIEATASTEPRTEELDRITIDVGQGPALEARGGHAQVVVRDTHAEERWPDWAEGMAAAGVRSVLCVGISTAQSDLGVLSLYDPAPGRFGVDEAAVASILARHAAVALGSARRAENLWVAIDARKLIGQAQGILMERFGLSADDAFGVLMRYSHDKNVKLRDVADHLVAERQLPGWPESASSGATPSR